MIRCTACKASTATSRTVDASRTKALLRQGMLVPIIRLRLLRLTFRTLFRSLCYSQHGQRHHLQRRQHRLLPQPQSFVHKAQTTSCHLVVTPMLPCQQCHQHRGHMHLRSVLSETMGSQAKLPQQAQAQNIRPSRSLLTTRLLLQPTHFQQPGRAPLCKSKCRRQALRSLSHLSYATRPWPTPGMTAAVARKAIVFSAV